MEEEKDAQELVAGLVKAERDVAAMDGEEVCLKEARGEEVPVSDDKVAAKWKALAVWLVAEPGPDRVGLVA